MSNYVQNTNFATKDALPSGDPLKIVRGTEINTEFNNIATAVATKADTNSPTFTGVVTSPSFVGPLTGNVTGSLTGNVTGDVTGELINVNSLVVADAATIEGITVGRGGGSLETNTAVGFEALQSNNNANGFENTAVGYRALKNTVGDLLGGFIPFGFANTAVGANALENNISGIGNTAVGDLALQSNTSSSNTAVGFGALKVNTSGFGNVAIGEGCLIDNTTGKNNTSAGVNSLASNTIGENNTACGVNSLLTNVTFDNVSGFGNSSAVTGSNQVQLGNSSTTTFVFGTVQSRSDLRDKADVRDTTLGLNFINALRPVDYKWDMRDDYRPERPTDLPDSPTPEQEAAHKAEIAAWLEAVKQDNLVRDGSKKRNRYHHGLIAQEVKAVLEQQNIDFGGYQDHKISGGHDVLSIGYDELIGPMIKAIQELKAEFDAYKLAHP